MQLSHRQILNLLSFAVLAAVVGCGPSGQHRVSIRRAAHSAAKPAAAANTQAANQQKQVTPAKQNSTLPQFNVSGAQANADKQLQQIDDAEKSLIQSAAEIHAGDLAEGQYKLESADLKFAYIGTDNQRTEALQSYAVSLQEENGKVTANPQLQQQQGLPAAGLMNDSDVNRQFEIPLDFAVKKTNGQWMPNSQEASNGLLSMQYIPSVKDSHIQASLSLENSASGIKASLFSILIAGQTAQDTNGQALQLRIYKLADNKIMFKISADEDSTANLKIAHRFHSAYLTYSFTAAAAAPTATANDNDNSADQNSNSSAANPTDDLNI